MGDLSVNLLFTWKLFLKIQKYYQTTESWRKIKQIPIDHEFCIQGYTFILFAPDYSTSVLAAQICTY